MTRLLVRGFSSAEDYAKGFCIEPTVSSERASTEAWFWATSTSLVKARLTSAFVLVRVWADRDGVAAYVLRT